MTTIFVALRDDHDTQRRLLRQLVETEGDSEGRRGLFAQVRSELDLHAACEEQVFYSALMAIDLTQEKARHSVAEHKEIDDLLEELEQIAMDSSAWLPKARQLRERVNHHLDEEEHTVFQLAGKALGPSEKVRLASEFTQLRDSKQA